MSVKLRELIKNVRSCKTAQEERGVIAKECALMRTSFKEEDAIEEDEDKSSLTSLTSFPLLLRLF